MSAGVGVGMAFGAGAGARTEAGDGVGGADGTGAGLEGEKRRTFTGVEGEGLANHVELLAKFPRLMELVSTPWVQVQLTSDSEGDQSGSPLNSAEGTAARLGGRTAPPAAASPSAGTPVEEAKGGAGAEGGKGAEGAKEGGGEGGGDGGEENSAEGVVAVVRLELIMTEYPDLWLQFKEVSLGLPGITWANPPTSRHLPTTRPPHYSTFLQSPSSLPHPPPPPHSSPIHAPQAPTVWTWFQRTFPGYTTPAVVAAVSASAASVVQQRLEEDLEEQGGHEEEEEERPRLQALLQSMAGNGARDDRQDTERSLPRTSASAPATTPAPTSSPGSASASASAPTASPNGHAHSQPRSPAASPPNFASMVSPLRRQSSSPASVVSSLAFNTSPTSPSMTIADMQRASR